MKPKTSRTLTREQLYDLVWQTPMRTLAPQFGLSDVGLAKICKKHEIPRPPVGYWAKLEHGKKVRKPRLPPPSAGSADAIRIEERPPSNPDDAAEPVFFDPDLAALHARVESGELVQRVHETLRGCHPAVARTRDWLNFKARPVRRDQWGGYEPPARYEGSHLDVSASKEHHRRAFLLLDAAVKTVAALGAQIRDPTDQWYRCVAFELRGFEFGIGISERNRQVKHELTKEEQDRKRRTGHYWGPKHDLLPTGDLRLRATYTSSRSHFFQVQDGKTRRLEDRIGDFAAEIVRRADDGLKRAAKRAAEQVRAAERAQREREEAERRRLEEERRRAEQARREALIDLSERWHLHQRLEEFLAECRRQAGRDLSARPESNIMERWFAWAADVAAAVDPLGRGVGRLPEVTHPSHAQPPTGSDGQ